MVGGTAEVTASQPGSMPVGVISEKPAFLMNSEGDGQAIALKGRVPVKVIGTINKGDIIYVADNNENEDFAGAGSTTAQEGAHIVGVALESSTDSGCKLVECVLKL